MSKSFGQAKYYLGKEVEVKIDRPLGSKHPKYASIYPVNYGFVPDTLAPDGEELDAYVLKVFEPVEVFVGDCIAIVHRKDDDDDKLVVVPPGESMSDEEITDAVRFQEEWFDSEIRR